MTYKARGYKQAGQTEGRADVQADGPNRAKIALLARKDCILKVYIFHICLKFVSNFAKIAFLNFTKLQPHWHYNERLG